MSDLVDDILDDVIARVAKVRRWLLALGVLKTATLWLVCISLYIGSYAVLDHRVHLGTSGRLLALALLVGLLAVLTYYLVRTLRRDMTYSRAANHVENRQSFDQQLVAAVEYYEKGDDYPYSRSLARQLVVQVDAASRDFAFDSTVVKWHGYLLAACIVLCLSVVAVFVHQNIVYFSAYFSRLVRPFSAIAPVPTTVLTSTTGDIVTAPNVPVTLIAEATRGTPDSAELVLTRQRETDASDMAPELSQRTPLRPQVDAAGKTVFTASPSFETFGTTNYRFETLDARSQTHTITVARPPAIEMIAALVSLPGKNAQEILPPREEKIEERSLAVLPYSRIELQVKVTTPLREATISGLDEEPMVRKLNGERAFNVKLIADRPMSLTFCLIGAEGLANSEPETLQITLKPDGVPRFKLLSPEGDCLVTNVASIPIAFEIIDDFGLETARLCCELPGAESVVLDTNDPQGGRQTQVSHTLELEGYDLKVGDSILFYAEARDIVTGQRRMDVDCASSIYFIEIRPYRQYWHPQPGGRSSSSPGAAQDDLMTVLEYTRAILKKTWALAQTPTTAARDLPKFEALCLDIEYCIEALAKLRDDPENGFDENTKSTINQVMDLHNQAKGRLWLRDADGALPSERDAYRTLRKLIDELHMKWNPPSSGQSVPQEKPERVTLQERPDTETPQDQQRTENQLEKVQQKIDELTREQKSLKADLAKSLQQQSQTNGEAQASESSSPASSSSGQSAGDSSEAARPETRAAQQPEGAQSAAGEKGEERQEGEEGQGQTSNEVALSETKAASEESQDNALEGAKGSQGQSKTSQQQDGPSQASNSSNQSQSNGGQQGTGREPSDSSKAPQGQGRPGEGPAAKSGDPSQAEGTPSAEASAVADARMRMLEARQKALHEQASALAEELAQMALPESSNHAGVRDRARQRLDEATESMRSIEDKLADLRYDPDLSADEEAQMASLAETAARELAEASQTIEQGLSAGKSMTDAERAEALARQLAEDAESLDESLSPEQREQMQERLEAAERLLESMAQPQWSAVSGGAAGGASHVYTRDNAANQIEAARLLAQQFWSVAIQARDRQVRPVEDEPSDVEFFEVENEFFENAAKFKPQGNPK